ncbi:hypothetical protein VIN01S_26650 [Vibrio inusitatus NBRC 102082]|uniref:Uncharacterized protein n=1 Tax=Vibrio inusitatus NBRC 102082 TaxID=1219070 RepID=A0A4Y3HY13_9VIBR|nr:hypothetical protein [Vibrio inusitatus]GEA51861.1 hypothetical protein VIN01S_26650 [Vibrio inusitatus NBRC 102082]
MLKLAVVATFCLYSATALACGLHQSTGFNMAIEEGSLDVFASVIEVRQSGELNNINKPDHFRLFSFKSSLEKAHPNKADFSIFEAIKGHYSDVAIGSNVQITGMDNLPTDEEVLLITELDVLDALATGTLSWEQAKLAGLVRINGPEKRKRAIDLWFSQIFQG